MPAACLGLAAAWRPRSGFAKGVLLRRFIPPWRRRRHRINFGHERWGFIVQANRFSRVCLEDALKRVQRHAPSYLIPLPSCASSPSASAPEEAAGSAGPTGW